jgi:hypothetical protein
MENFKHGQTSPEVSHSSESHANQLHASSQAAAKSGDDSALNANNDANNAASNTAKIGATDDSKNAVNNAAQNSSSAPSGAGPKAPETSGSADQSAQGAQPHQSAISKAAAGKRLGMRSVLPGESSEKYMQGLTSTIEEFGAKSLTQVYLAEQFFKCLWSINRYEVQKRESLIAEMIKALKGNVELTPDKLLNLTILLQEGNWDTPGIQNILKTCGFTNSSLTQRAMERRMPELMQLDQSIALKVQSLSGIQKSYEALVSRSVMQERLKLQNDLLKRDLQAIDISAVERNADLPDDQLQSAGQEKPQEFKDKQKNVDHKSTIASKAIDQGRDQDVLAPSDVVPKDSVPKDRVPKDVLPKDTVLKDTKSKSPPRPKDSADGNDQNDL